MKGFRIILFTVQILTLIIVFQCLGGCKKKTPEDTFIAAQKALVSLENYSVTVNYKVTDDGGEREYRFNQWVSMPSSFKIELTAPENLIGKTIISDGLEILINHPKVADSIKFDLESLEQQRPLFIGDFLNTFLLSEDVGKEVYLEAGIEYVILTFPSSRGESLEKAQELWLRSPKMVPVKLLTYGRDGKVEGQISFEDFDRSWKPKEGFYDFD